MSIIPTFPGLRLLVLLCLLTTLSGRAQNADKDFYATEIPDSIFRLMQNRSYKKNCTVKRSSLRYVCVKHFDAEGREHRGELVCHRDIAADLVSIFRALHAAHYPIERMRLIDYYEADDTRSMTANNTSAFNFRYIAGTRKLSNHSYGRAIDINPLYNPFVKANGKVEPAVAKRYANRQAAFPYKISRNDLCYRLFRQHGFTWGGDWRHSKDYQHFEKKITPKK